MNRAMTEKQLIEELRCGNESAFRRIYDRHYVPLCRFADLFLHDASLSEEVVDDAIFYLWEHRSEVEITYSLKAYLMKSVRNRCLNELNSLAHREELQFSSFSLPENVEFLDTLFIEKDHIYRERPSVRLSVGAGTGGRTRTQYRGPARRMSCGFQKKSF